MTTFRMYRSPSRSEMAELVTRPSVNTKSLHRTIEDIFDRVKERGDDALFEYTRKFDGVHVDQLEVSREVIKTAASALPNELRKAIDVAYGNIESFHESQKEEKRVVETTAGVICWRESRPVEKVGLYIPGGTAPLFSSVLMLAIPAVLAGCKEIILCSPPGKNGDIHPAVLYAAGMCGVHRVYRVGGAQAIAAMTLGTDSIPAVYKIFGPGNQYVTAAKMKSTEYGVAIDLPAGPSEVLVYADLSANPDFVAADLLSQAEHGTDSQVVLVSTSETLVDQVGESMYEQLKSLPRREIAEQALSHAYACVYETPHEAFAFINAYAPEHFIIASDRADEYAGLINNAGSVFLGNHTPESAGDYASGTNHTLPTAAYARSYSGVSLDSFIKKITFQKITPAGLRDLGPSIVQMARAESLEAHARAVLIRTKED